jgi:3'-5' exoribonuclease
MKIDIQANAEVNTFFALESMKLKTNGNKKKYLELRLYDYTGKIKGYVWNEPELMFSELKEKTIISVIGSACLYNGSLLLNVTDARVAQKYEYDIDDFEEPVEEGISYWEGELNGLVEEIKEANCRRIIDSFLSDKSFKSLFVEAPEKVSIRRGYIGELLKHTVMIMSQGFQLSKDDPERLDRDLLMTGAFLHDIGKIRELYWEVGCAYTDIGKLVGHIGLGLMMLEEKFRMKDFPEDLALLLKHMILSHHGAPAVGSPVEPAIPEAVVLQMLETTETKLEHLRYSTPEGVWSGYGKCISSEILHGKYTKVPLKSKEDILV